MAKEEGLIKLVADRSRGVLVGGCVVGPAGGEILSVLGGRRARGDPDRARCCAMHFAYPTYHRALETVLAQLIDQLLD